MTAESLIRAYYDAFNKADIAALLDLLTEDVIHDINQGARETGKSAFAAFLDQMNQCYRETITDLTILTEPAATRAAAEFTVHGAYLQASPGMPPAHGQPYTLAAGAFFTLRDHKIARVTTYYNLPAWLSQVS
jgi:steroid delta-isomerase-like uncharacterized protein